MRPDEVICYGTSSCGGSFDVVTQDICCTHGIGPVGFSFRTGEHEGCTACPVGEKYSKTCISVKIMHENAH